MTKENENQPDDDKLPKINLAELREKKRQILQRNYAQNNAQNGDSGKPIDLSEIRQKKRQIQKQKELEEEIVLPFTVPRPEDEEEQTLPFSIDREAEEEIVLPFTVPMKEEEEEGVLPFAIGYKQPEGEAERLDEVLGKDQRIAQYGITSKELRSRSVVLEFQTSDGKDEVYSWTAAAEKDYALLEQMSCFEAVGYILARAPLKKADGTLPDTEGKERLRLEKSLLEGDFGITTEDSGALLPEGKGKYTVGGRPSPDERQRPLLEYLRSGKDSKGRDVWHQRFGVCLPFSLDDIAKE
ncbi:hypothetical protein KY338_04005 [Candidatus Woesearchaeota archaeon]|nr:hypothetical protein [Candidatus Woesearchaeota archaeon]MBW3005477.1 hypothetical protein [Candidatus Woesearchaeota archaeon]